MLYDFTLKTSYIPENEKTEEGFFKEWKDYMKAKKNGFSPHYYRL